MFVIFVFFKQKTAYEMRISDWSSDVCSSDLIGQMMCAEQAVEKREVDREILVDRDLLYRMMPVVEARRRDDAAEMVEIAAQIGVEQRGVDIDEADKIGRAHV